MGFRKLGRPSPSMFVAVLALVMSTAGGAYAAATIGSKQIKNESIKSVDIKNGQVSTKDIKNGTIRNGDIRPSTLAGFGPGDAFLDEKFEHSATSGNEASHTVLTLDLAPGNYVVSASLALSNTSPDARDFTCRIENPIGIFTGVIAESTDRIDANDGYRSIGLSGAVDVDTVENSPVTLTCVANAAPWAAEISSPRLVAVEVGALTEQ